MSLLILLILHRHRLSMAAFYRVLASIWFVGVLFLVPAGEYYLALLHCIIGVLLLSVAAPARGAAPVHLTIGGPLVGPIHIDLHQ
jgi:hypothetical protein